MKSYYLMLLLAICLYLPGIAMAEDAQTLSPPNQGLIVSLNSNKPITEINGHVVVDQIPEYGLYLIKPGESESVLKELGVNEDIESVEINYKSLPVLLGNPLLPSPDSILGEVGFSVSLAALSVSLPKKVEQPNPRVALIDSGIDLSHPDISDLSIAYSLGYNFANDSKSLWPANKNDYHGSAVSSLFQDDISIVPIIWCGDYPDEESCTVFSVLKSIAYAKKLGVKIINGSFYSDVESPALSKIIKQNKDILFVSPSGNGGYNLEKTIVSYPCRLPYKNVICVGSINKNNQLSKFSNYGENSVDFVTQADPIMVALPTFSAHSLANRSKERATSFATERVVSLANSLLEKKKLSAGEIKDTLAKRAQRVRGVKYGKL